jgi:hypothetical protein
MRASPTSPAFYAFAYHDEAWRQRVIGAQRSGFDFDGTWRQTHLRFLYNREFESTPIKLKNFFSDSLFQPVS